MDGEGLDQLIARGPIAVDEALRIALQIAHGLEAAHERGIVHREHYKRTADGLEPLTRTGEIWGEYNMVSFIDEEGNTSARSTGFFVGTLAEYRESERPHLIRELPDLPPPPE
ncbi:MAG: hypothetical protein QNL88_04040 [Acidobacteriota bacterium]|nr:hypothetical protein [Acidobacteriota bacterium]